MYKEKSWLYNEYINSKKSTIKIAMECNVWKGTILYWLKKYDIPRRIGAGWSKGKKMDDETKRKRVESRAGYKHSEETREKMSKSHKGKKFSKETKERMSVAKRKISNETRMKMSIAKKNISDKTRQKMSASKQGIDFEDWKGFVSFEPYCYLFNEEKKEEIRNRDNRVCQMPGCDKSEILNGQRLSVHHIDGDKIQGCEGKKFYLVSLCLSCNSKTDTIVKEFLIVADLKYRLKESVND